jgi:hypothetical protein
VGRKPCRDPLSRSVQWDCHWLCPGLTGNGKAALRGGVDVVQSEVIYESEALRSFARIYDEGGPILCTFSNYQADGGKHHAFGAEFADRNRINAIHFISGANDWLLQEKFDPDYRAWVQRVMTFPAYVNASRRIGYGSSMGGYAALRFRDRLRFDRVIAFSPQYALDPAKVPFERRWKREFEMYGDAAMDVMRPVWRGEDIVLIHDPMVEWDVQHIRLIDPDRHALDLGVPFGAHPPALFLSHVGVLSDLTLRLVAGDSDMRDLLRRASRARRTSWLFWLRLADFWFYDRSMPKKALWAVDQGLKRAPEHPELVTFRERVMKHC